MYIKSRIYEQVSLRLSNWQLHNARYVMCLFAGGFQQQCNHKMCTTTLLSSQNIGWDKIYCFPPYPKVWRDMSPTLLETWSLLCGNLVCHNLAKTNI